MASESLASFLSDYKKKKQQDDLINNRDNSDSYDNKAVVYGDTIYRNDAEVNPLIKLFNDKKKVEDYLQPLVNAGSSSSNSNSNSEDTSVSIPKTKNTMDNATTSNNSNNNTSSNKTGFWDNIRQANVNMQNAIENNPIYKDIANSGVGKFISRMGQSGAEMTGATTGDKNYQVDTTGNKIADTVASGVGALMGLVSNPGGLKSVNEILSPAGNLAEKGTTKLEDKLGQLAFKNAPNPTTYNVLTKAASYLPTMARTGAEQGLQGAILASSNGENAKDIAKEGLLNAGQGAIFGGAMKGLGDLGKSAFKTNVTVDREQLNNPNGVLKPLESTQTLSNTDNIKNNNPSTTVQTTLNENGTNTLLNNKGTSAASTELNKANNIISQTPSSIEPGQKYNIKNFGDVTVKSNDGKTVKFENANGTEIPMETKYFNKNATYLGNADNVNTGNALERAMTSSVNNGPQKSNISMDNSFQKVNDNLYMPEVQPTEDTKLNKFTQTVKDSELTTQGLKDTLPQQEYNTITNKDTIRMAQKIINGDKDKAKEYVMSDRPATATSNAMAQLLAKQAQDEGNYTDAIAIIQKTSEKATKAGQAIQALSIWNKLTPEGMLKFASQSFDKANMTLPKNKQVTMTEDFAKNITDTMKEINKMPDGYEKTVETQKVLKGIANKIPSSNLKKIDTFQTLAQLLNPKTSIRNILGNAGMQFNENLSNVVGTGIDKGVSLFTGNRTVGMPSLKTQLQGLKEGTLNSIKDIKNGVNLDNTQFDLPDSQVFNNNKLSGKILNSGQKMLDYMLKVPDEATKTAIRNDSLRTQMKLAGVTEPTDEMLQIAENDAKYGTFQDDNKVSKAFSNFKNAFNGGKEFGLGSLLLKYPKTPANIIMRAIDYSPAGFFKAAYRLAEPVIQHNDFDQRDFVKSTSRALVGTGNLIGTGYLFNKLGIITGKSSTDTDTANMQKQTGLGDYKLNLSSLKRFVTSGFNPYAAKIQKGDTIINYDWFQPSSIGLAIGANAADKAKNGTDYLTTIADSINSGVNTLAQQPVVSGVTNFFGQGKFNIGNAFISTIKGIPASLMPTVLKQVAQVSDNTTRSTYDPSWINQMGNMAKAKIPGASQTLQPKLDSLGNEQKAYENNNLFNVFLNPSYVTKYNPKQAAQLPIDIYNNTGNVTSMPRQTPTYIMDKGQKILLTPEEATYFQREVGQKTQQAINALGNAPANDNTAKQIQSLMTAIQADVKDKILNNRGISTQKTKQTGAEKVQTRYNSLQKKKILNNLGIH